MEDGGAVWKTWKELPNEPQVPAYEQKDQFSKFKFRNIYGIRVRRLCDLEINSRNFPLCCNL